MEKIYFARENENIIIPAKRAEDGAFDVYAYFEEDYLIVKPHTTRMIPTGLRSAFSKDYVAIIKERGSTGSKGIGQRAGVIDSGYRGLWFIPITNHNNIPLVINKENVEIPDLYPIPILYPYNKAIAQVVMVEVPKLEVEEISVEDILKMKSERGTGALGSSGK